MSSSDCTSAVTDDIEILCHMGSSTRLISPEIQKWAETLAVQVRLKTTGQAIALVWPYRQHNTEYLSVDINGATGSVSLTFMTGVAHDFGTDDVEVPDMTEALVMTAVLLKEIKAEVTFYV
ncbi:hypothetical protein [Pseudomonas viridiflava]|uniref:hypothetical protein n=1 Tax=Pseudomonas viridiflava TaxID=33069 RepID=UPI000F04882A|nr:hypothetical protein [Pseudomonas viridiflava]